MERNMTDQQNNVITIDGTEYNYDELSDRVKYCIAQVNDLRGQLDAAKARVDQLNMAHDGFLNMLRLEMEKGNEDTEVTAEAS
jgi:division protein CdvB (Snf7/Vps24/ESCRT-III family)